MNGLANNGEPGADGSAKKGWRTLTRVAAVSGALCVLFSVATFVGAAASSERVSVYSTLAALTFVAAVGAFAWRFDALRAGVFGTFAAAGRGLKSAPKRFDAATGFSATCRRVASALTRRGKREVESAEPVSAILDLSTLEAGGAAAFFWTNAIYAFLTEPSWTWAQINEDNLPGSCFWGAFGLLLTAIALFLLTTRAVWTVALLCRKKGVQATLLFGAGLIVSAVALLEGAGLILAVWER